jgi:hypothetical protein
MKIRNPIPAGLVLAVLLSIIHSPVSTAFAQGSLTPPGPPAPSMLTLNQIEPRTPVDAVHTPGDGSTTEFIISQSGSYYLTTNIVGLASENGIDITANNVTLDLNGFSLTGPSTAHSGIGILSGTTNVIVRNGIISGWNSSGDTVFSLGKNVVFENLSISGADISIACFGDGGVVRNCTLSHNSEYGIYVAGPNYLIVGNDLVENNTINELNGSAILISAANNRIDGNFVTGSGPAGYGIDINAIAGITNNIVIRNSVFGNSGNDYYFNSSQIVGPLITNTVSGIVTNSNPWANFAF